MRQQRILFGLGRVKLFFFPGKFVTSIITVKTVTLGGFHLKLIFDNRKLKILVFASFSPCRYNLSIVKGSFCRYASGLVALQSTCHCRRFTVRFIAVDNLGNDRQLNPGLMSV